MRARSRLMATVSMALAGAAAYTSPHGTAVQAQGSIAIIQAVPGTAADVRVDGTPLEDGVETGTVLGPQRLAAGSHEIDFAFDQGEVAATVDVAAGTTSDVVVHRPAEVGGDPIVSVYLLPMDPIGPGEARVLLAHTATTAPADVEFDGTVVFTNIANGEYAQADVPAGAHRVALVPSGVDAPPILGPLDVDLKAATLTAVYAVGNPRTRSMNVIVHETPLQVDDTEPPGGVDTGSVGLVSDVSVRTFGPDR